MVLRGPKLKIKAGNHKETPARPFSSKMGPPNTSRSSAQRTTTSLPHSLKAQHCGGETDSEEEYSQATIQSGILKQFEKMLQKALKQTSDDITDKLTKEIREIGQRTAKFEVRVDELKTYTQQHMEELEYIKEEKLILQNRLENQENLDRCSTLRIRGIPEHVLDLQATMLALFQELLPGTPVERLEMDRVHRALAPHRSNGPARDIIVRFHYYRTKEQLLAAARGNSVLTFQDNAYQLFSDLSPLTVTKRRSLKPFLQILQRHQIIYHWGFPFSLRFTHLETKYVCRTSEELQTVLIYLGLLDQPETKYHPHRRSASCSSSQQDLSKPKSSARQNLHKRGRFETLSPPNVDSMD